MKRSIAMIFGLCFASLWLGCGMGEDEAWSDEDGVVPQLAEDFGNEEGVGPPIDPSEHTEPDLDLPAPLSDAAGESE